MRYFLRSVKWFLYCVILFLLIILALHLLGSVDARNVETLFRDGYNSLWQIALFLAALSAVYPLFGYMKRSVSLTEGLTDGRDIVIQTLAETGYVLRKEEGNVLVFKSESMFTRILQMGEDSITVTLGSSSVELEGRRRNLARIISRVEHRLSRR